VGSMWARRRTRYSSSVFGASGRPFTLRVSSQRWA
jgi:hypothetical protein